MCKFYCSTDRGLKKILGTSGYVMIQEGSQRPMITGHSAKLQYSVHSSSIRQELRAQLAVEFWLLHFQEVFGEPHCSIEVRIVKDSQASTEIVDKLGCKVGLKDVTNADTDIAMAILHCRESMPWAKYSRTKV